MIAIYALPMMCIPSHTFIQMYLCCAYGLLNSDSYVHKNIYLYIESYIKLFIIAPFIFVRMNKML